MSSDESNAPFKSPYPELKLPEGGFQSNIPPSLLENADDQMRWLMNEMSKANQAIQWTCHGLIDTNAHVRKTNGRLLKAEAEIKESKDKLDTLDSKATLMEPLFKPLSLFMRMWEYKIFRWACYILVFFFFTYALPYYLLHPLSLSGLWTLLVGT